MEAKEISLVDDVTYYVDQYTSKGLCLDNYSDWVDRGFEFASLGEAGRESFHRISSTSSKYNHQQADDKFTNLCKNHDGKRNIESFFYHCTNDLQIPPLQVNTTYKKAKPKVNGTKKEVPEDKWLFTVKDVLNAPAQETIWSFIVKGVNNALVASSEAGKSTLLLNLAIAIARELLSFLGWPLGATKSRCIYVSTEDGISQLKTRLKAMLGNSVIPDDSILFILDGTDLAKRLDETLEKYPSDLVILDTWGDFVGGKYDAEFTRKTMQEIRRVCVKHDSTPLYVHHTNKASENIPDKSSIKGAGDFEQACRVVMMLSIYQDNRWLCCVKGNPFPDDTKNTCYELSYNPETQSFGRTENEKSRHEIVQELRSENLGRPSAEIDFSVLAGQRLNNTSLCKTVIDNYGVSRATAQTKIKKAYESGILAKDQNGLYYEK